MIRFLAAALVLASAVLPAGAVLARGAEAPAASRPAAVRAVVEDPDGVLAAGQADALRGRLGALPTRGVALVFVRTAKGGAERVAQQAFDRLRLPDDALAVAVAVGDREVAAKVGPVLRRRGVDRTVITGLIGAHFKAQARAGRYDLGALALADAIARHGAAGAPGAGRHAAAERPPAPAAPAREEEGGTGTLLLGLFLLLLTAAFPLVVLWMLYKLARKLWSAFSVRVSTVAPFQERLAALRAARARIAEGVVALDGTMALARGGDDHAAETATAVMAEAQAFGPRVDALPAEPAATDLRAEPEITALTMVALNLEVSLAALRTRYDASAPAAVRDALKLGRRWKLADAQVDHLALTGKGDPAKRAVLVDLAAKAREALTGVPQDLDHATALVTEIETTLEALGLTRVEAAAPPTTASARVPAASHHHFDGCWHVEPIYVHAVSHAYHHDAHHDDAHHHEPTTAHEAFGGSSWWGAASTSAPTTPRARAPGTAAVATTAAPRAGPRTRAPRTRAPAAGTAVRAPTPARAARIPAPTAGSLAPARRPMHPPPLRRRPPASPRRPGGARLEPRSGPATSRGAPMFVRGLFAAAVLLGAGFLTVRPPGTAAAAEVAAPLRSAPRAPSARQGVRAQRGRGPHRRGRPSRRHLVGRGRIGRFLAGRRPGRALGRGHGFRRLVRPGGPPGLLQRRGRPPKEPAASSSGLEQEVSDNRRYPAPGVKPGSDQMRPS